MCEGYWDRRRQEWVSLEELQEEELETITDTQVALPPPAAEPKRKPAMLAR